MGLSSAQMGAVEGLVRGAPDALLMRLNAALSVARHSDPVFAPVSDIARAETDDRRARDIVLSPITHMARMDLVLPKRPLLSPGDLPQLWRLMKRLAPELTQTATFAALAPASHAPPPPIYDTLCVDLAAALREEGAAALAPRWSAAERERMARLLMLTPILRLVIPRLPAWVRNLNSEHMAAVRLSYKDAIATAEDVGPMFIEVLQPHLEEPSHILRIISAVMDRPSDRYLASSELAGIGERLLEDVDLRIQTVKNFDPDRGLEGGAAEAASVLTATNTVKEFEQWLALSKDGPWGARVAAQKLALALASEARMREADRAVGMALPLQPQRAAGGVMLRPVPKIDGAPNETLVRRASGLLAFLDETRAAAANAGFGSVRAKVIETLEIRLDAYVEDLVDRLRAPDGVDKDEVRAYMEVAADFLGLTRGPKAAQIVRRRAASA